MLGLKIFVQVQAFRRKPFAPLHNFCHPKAHNFKLVQLSAIEIKLYMIQFFWLCHSTNFNESGLKMVRINVRNFFNVVTKFLHRRELAAVLLCITHRHVWYILELKFHVLSFYFSPTNIDRKTERQKDRKTERQKDRKTERQKDRKTERRKDGKT